MSAQSQLVYTDGLSNHHGLPAVLLFTPLVRISWTEQLLWTTSSHHGYLLRFVYS